MKKFIALLFLAIGVLAIAALFILTNDPASQVRAVSHSRDGRYEELLVVMQNRTYEQLLRKPEDDSIILHKGTWIPANEMPEGEKLLGKEQVIKFVAFQGKLDPNTALRPQLMFEEASKLQSPDEKTLALWQEWRAKATATANDE